MLALAGLALVVAMLLIRIHRDGFNPRRALGAIRGERDPAQLIDLAKAFEGRGYPETAGVLRTRAEELKAGGPRPGPALLVSPLREASDLAWTRFVLGLARSHPGAVSARGYLGMFGLGAERLEDLGYLRRSGERGGGQVTVHWVPPLSQKAFLASPEQQYRALARSMVEYRRAILARWPQVPGQMLAGRVATLSGLLGAAHQAGLGGLGAWLDARGDAARFPDSTAAYLRSVGAF